MILFLFVTEILEYSTNRLEFNLTKKNSGQYQCVAFNSNGKDEKTIFVDYFGK